MTPTYGDMSCQELVELVTDYLEGALPGDVSRRFEIHLHDCPWCVTYVEQIRTTAKLVGRSSAELEQLPGMDRLLDAFRGWKRDALPGTR